MENPYLHYRQQSIQTASPGKLILMLYDGLIKFLKQARNSLGKGKLEEANRFLIRAQDILTELDADLNMDFEISHHLRGIYSFLRRQVIFANVHKDSAVVDQCLRLCVELREAWVQVVENQGREGRSKSQVDIAR